MRIIPFYIVHTTKNLIKRTLHSKGGIAMILFFVVFTVIMVISVVGGKPQPDPTATELIAEQMKKVKANQIFGMVVSGVFLLFFFFQLVTGDKKGSQIFQMSDVNFLFAAPIRPQSILIFRILLQMGASLLGTVYMIYQMPNLVVNVGLSFGGAFGILLCYFLMLVLGTLCSIYIYCFCANHPWVKENIHRIIYGLYIALILAYVVQLQFYKLSVYDAGVNILNGTWFNKIPIIGWLKGLTMAFIDNNMRNIVLYGVLCVLSILVLILLIYRTPADYYEDAMETAKKMHENLVAVKEGRTIERKRSDKINRTQLIRHGFGANIFYYKSVDMVKRFAKLGYFTSTNQFFWVLCLGSAFLTRFVIKSNALFVIVPIMALISLFLSMGNALATEISLNYIFLVPETAEKKIIYCSLADLRNFVFDSSIPYLVAMIILKADLVLAIGCYLMIVSLYFISDQMGAWLELIFPSTTSMATKVILIYMKFLAVIPGGIALLIGLALGNLTIGIYASAIFSIPSGVIFMCLCPGLLKKGKK